MKSDATGWRDWHVFSGGAAHRDFVNLLKTKPVEK